MLNIHAACDLWGENFSPRAVEKATGIGFHRKNEPGEIATLGRYRGKPRPYGSATLVLREGGERGELVSPKAIRFVGQHLDDFRRAGATDIDITINVGYSGQCNLGLGSELLRALASLGIPLALTCYEDDTLDED